MHFYSSSCVPLRVTCQSRDLFLGCHVILLSCCHVILLPCCHVILLSCCRFVCAGAYHQGLHERGAAAALWRHCYHPQGRASGGELTKEWGHRSTLASSRSSVFYSTVLHCIICCPHYVKATSIVHSATMLTFPVMQFTRIARRYQQ